MAGFSLSLSISLHFEKENSLLEISEWTYGKSENHSKNLCETKPFEFYYWMKVTFGTQVDKQ